MSDILSVNRLKQRAKALKKQEGITQAEALDRTAQSIGYESWRLLSNSIVIEQTGNSFNPGSSSFTLSDLKQDVAKLKAEVIDSLEVGDELKKGDHIFISDQVAKGIGHSTWNNMLNHGAVEAKVPYELRTFPKPY